MNKLSTLAVLALASLAFLVTPLSVASAASTYTQNWNSASSGNAGWGGVDTPVNAARFDLGGNPGGYLQTSTANTQNESDTGARALGNIAELTGDYTGMDWTVNFDILLEAGTIDAAMFRLRGNPPGQGWVVDLGALPQLGGWTTYTIRFSGAWTEAEARANGWSPDNEHPVLHPTAPMSNTWAQTVSNVQALSIRFSGDNALTTTGLDNFTLVGDPVASVPEPSTAMLLGLGLSLFAARRHTRL